VENLQQKLKINASIFSRHISALIAGVLFFSLLALYSNLIKTDPLLSYDDRPLVGAIESISSVKTYVAGIKNGFIPDIQPVRDFSYLIDIWTMKNTTLHSFHLTNLLIWWLIVVIFFHLIKQQSNLTLATVFAIYVAFNPVFASSIAWVAARKHLLSTLFIISATYFCVQKKDQIYSLKNFSTILIFYILSVLSQPINVLWPLWFFAYTYKKSKKLPQIILLSVMVILIFANYRYYNSELFESISAFGKFNSEGLSPGTSLLALGRYFLLSFIPFGALPHSHYQGSIENIVGLFLFSLALALLFVKSNKQKIEMYLAFLYFLLPLGVVTFKTTNVFCSDTYLLNASLGLYWLICLMIKDSIHIKKISVFILLYALVAGTYTITYLKAFESDRDLWSYSYNKEKNSHSTMVMTLFSIKDRNFSQANQLIDLMKKEWPEQPFISQLSSEVIFFNDDLSSNEKIAQLESIKNPGPSVHFYLVLLYARENKTAQLTRHLEEVFRNPNQLRLEFWGKEERVGAIYSYTCHFFQVKDCHGLELIKRDLTKDQFDEKLYNEYLQKLNRNKDYSVELKVN
jgi:hypothetical protein